MPYNAIVTIPARVWTQLTNADVPALACQNLGPYHVLIQASVGNTAPATPPAASMSYRQLWYGDHLLAATLLADMFPGLPGANRLWAWAEAPAQVSVSHA